MIQEVRIGHRGVVRPRTESDALNLKFLNPYEALLLEQQGKIERVTMYQHRLAGPYQGLTHINATYGANYF